MGGSGKVPKNKNINLRKIRRRRYRKRCTTVRSVVYAFKTLEGLMFLFFLEFYEGTKSSKRKNQ